MQRNVLPSSTKLLTTYPRVPIHSPCPHTAFPGGPLVTVLRANTLGQRRRRLSMSTLSTLALHSIRHASTVTYEFRSHAALPTPPTCLSAFLSRSRPLLLPSPPSCPFSPSSECTVNPAQHIKGWSYSRIPYLGNRASSPSSSSPRRDPSPSPPCGGRGLLLHPPSSAPC